jgi:hypothetical protein
VSHRHRARHRHPERGRGLCLATAGVVRGPPRHCHSMSRRSRLAGDCEESQRGHQGTGRAITPTSDQTPGEQAPWAGPRHQQAGQRRTIGSIGRRHVSASDSCSSAVWSGASEPKDSTRSRERSVSWAFPQCCWRSSWFAPPEHCPIARDGAIGCRAQLRDLPRALSHGVEGALRGRRCEAGVLPRSSHQSGLLWAMACGSKGSTYGTQGEQKHGRGGVAARVAVNAPVC